jgi:hypothetical protein
MNRSKLSTVAGVCAIGVGFAAISYAAVASYGVTREIHVGGPGAWDYATVDQVHRRLYVSHGT